MHDTIPCVANSGTFFFLNKQMVSKIDQMSVLFFDVFFFRGTVSVYLILKHNGSRDEATAGQAQKLTLHAPFLLPSVWLFFEVKNVQGRY